jgi:hypothetical protein
MAAMTRDGGDVGDSLRLPGKVAVHYHRNLE